MDQKNFERYMRFSIVAVIHHSKLSDSRSRRDDIFDSAEIK